MSGVIPYGCQTIDEEDIRAVTEVLRGEFLTQGPHVESFEKTIRDFCGVRFCVAVANGTAALHLAVAALGIVGGGEGITSPITFAASANCLLYNGLKPVFADIDELTYCISPAQIASRITKDTRVIIPVHFAGQPADIREIAAFAHRNGIAVIEDAAHAIGSSYEDGSSVGSCKHSDMTTFSFHPVKTVTTGEGGAVTTNDEDLYERLLLLRSHGITRVRGRMEKDPGPWYYEMQDLGFNYRLTDIQAALGVSQFRKLHGFMKRRREIVRRYNEAFRDIGFLVTPHERPGVDSTFHLYVLQIDFPAIDTSRKQVMEMLKEKGIGTQVHYIPVHLHPYYRKVFGFSPGDFPTSEAYYEKALSIPLYPRLTDSQVESVISSVASLGCAHA
jgi:perosamine synthetase